MILILEDDSERVHGFQRALETLRPGVALRVWANAHHFVRECAALLERAALICLDHDLVEVGGVDAGDGLDAARFLVSQPITRPVIIHSSNSERARMMQGEFELAGWECTRVLPLGDRWIEEDWAQVAAEVLRGLG